MNRETLKAEAARIVGQAAWCALDFKQADPSSITETRHCVQDCYEAARADYMHRMAKVGRPELLEARLKLAEQRWGEIRTMLNSIGYTW